MNRLNRHHIDFYAKPGPPDMNRKTLSAIGGLAIVLSLLASLGAGAYAIAAWWFS
jgi:hypothetical protein